MDQALRFLLQIGLILSSVAALTASLRIILGYALGTTWYWGGALAAYAGPLIFTVALYIDALRRRTELERWVSHRANVPESADGVKDGNDA
jgi:hypothetical protein